MTSTRRGRLGLLAVWFTSWLVPVALIIGLRCLLASLPHVRRMGCNANETVAPSSFNLLIAVVLLGQWSSP